MALKTQIKILRAHKLAALLVDARLYARRTPEEACTLLGWDLDHLDNLETAIEAPTLPEMEALAAIYAVPVDHFFGNTSLSDGMPRLRTETMTQRLELRNRILGAMIMQARLRRNFSRDDLSYATNIPLEQIIEYELGQVPIPVTDLEDITRMMQIDIADWIDSYAIPTRDMVFRPYKLGEVSSPAVEAVEEKPAAVIQEAMEPVISNIENKEPEIKPTPAVQSVPVSEPSPVFEQVQAPTTPVVLEIKPAAAEQVDTKHTSVVQEKVEEKQISESDMEFLTSADLPKELVDFITNPINRQYLLLASNLSRMPADQLRRIAESLLDITY